MLDDFTGVFSIPVKLRKLFFSGYYKKLSLVLLQMTNNYIYIALENCGTRMRYGLNNLVQGFYPLKIKIIQFPNYI